VLNPTADNRAGRERLPQLMLLSAPTSPTDAIRSELGAWVGAGVGPA
jgi:hypothetical protein